MGYVHRLAHSRHSPNKKIEIMENRKRAGDYGKREIVRYFTVKGTLFIKGEALLTIFPHQRMIE